MEYFYYMWGSNWGKLQIQWMKATDICHFPNGFVLLFRKMPWHLSGEPWFCGKTGNALALVITIHFHTSDKMIKYN
jgi:hypothetical protein